MKTRKVCFVVLSIAAMLVAGCKNAQKSTASAPTPQEQKATAPAASPPQPSAVVAKPSLLDGLFDTRIIQVSPPASFSGNELPEHGKVEFRVDGRAGQVLHVKISAEWDRSLMVQPMGKDSIPLSPGGDESGNYLYALPATGTYEVLGQHLATLPKVESSIQFAFRNIDDPMVDPGIRPEQIHIELGKSAPNAHWLVIPYADFEGVNDNWPSHLAIMDGPLEIRVMPMAGCKKVLPNEEFENLESALKAKGKGAVAQKFPYHVYGDAALTLATNPKFIQGDGWRGLRWIGQYAQDSGCGFDPLTYIFQAITDDGKHFIMMQTGISNSGAAQRLNKTCGARSEDRHFDSFFEKEMPELFDKEFTVAASSSFQPNLDELDAVIRSLKIRR